MKLHTLLALTVAVNAKSILRKEPTPDQVPLNGNDGLNIPARELFLIELSPGETAWVTEDEKWELRRLGQNFMDITANQETFPATPLQATTSGTKYPSAPAHNSTVHSLIKNLSKDTMRKNLETFTSFHTRYYKSTWGADSSNWLYGQVKDVVEMSGAAKNGATVTKFEHDWGQNSVIASIPGKSNKTIVIGAHQDSINLFLPSFLAAPGADDDGSGTVTILEALRALLRDDDVVAGKAPNTIEFQWYSAEEGGLLGSQEIFKDYSTRNVDVKAMLQQDMTGYTQKTLDAGEPESVGVITDFVDPDLTDFIRKTISTYCEIPYIETKCGYACSDHASASKYGYPSAFVIESDFKYSDTKIHTTEDKIEYLDFGHMLQHARMTLAFAYEMGFAEL